MITYRLHIRLAERVTVQVGKLGRFIFPAGRYVYTGSARRGLEARIARHYKKDKPLRWHIDYLTTRPQAEIFQVDRLDMPECAANRTVAGDIIAPGFGASDCRAGCGSHLRYIDG